MLKFDLAAPQGGSFEVSASDLGLSPEKFSDIQAFLKFKQLEGTTHIILEVEANVLMECDRTLREFVGPIVNVNEMILYPHGQKPPEDDVVEQVELAPRQQVFDLTEVLHDTLVLGIPVRKVAPDAEELQIQTVFGASPTEADQRWSPLLAVREEIIRN